MEDLMVGLTLCIYTKTISYFTERKFEVTKINSCIGIDNVIFVQMQTYFFVSL